MNVLLLRLSGPMQSWGVQSRFSVRDTGLEPSKSGVIGLLCAALGRPRASPLEDLASLRMGVRVDCEGVLNYDYHTAQNVLKAGGGLKDTEPSRRYYLADARFLVGLQGESHELLVRLDTALRQPIWPLYLGRKAFVPGDPIWLEDGVRRGAWLVEVLESYAWLGGARRARPARARLVFEDPEGAEVRQDHPLSFAERKFAPRRLSMRFIPLPPQEDTPCTSPA